VIRRATRAAALAALLAGLARAGEPEAPPPLEAPPETPASRPSEEGDTWIDESHRYIERELLGGLVWGFDSYFGVERPPDLDPPGSVVRWRSEGRVDETGRTRFRTAALADIRLPATQAWLSRTRLVFEGESTPDPLRPYTESAGDPAFSPSVKAEQAHLELRQVLVKARDTSLDAGAGIRLRILPDPFSRVRFRQRLDLGARFEARFGQAVSWDPTSGFGESTQLDFARPVAAHTILRWNNGANLSQVSSGLEWYAETGLAQELVSLRAAIWVAGAMAGHTRPASEITGYRAYTRLRRDLWRRWLFLELEPEVAWPLDPLRGRIRVFAVTLRTEVHFDGRSLPPEPEPEPGE
jgi:hypothetical protein